MLNKKIKARDIAIEKLGKKAIEILEQEGIKISWKHEYDLKEFILASENTDEILIKLDKLAK